MKKRFITLFALASLLCMPVCTTSCSSDDDEDNNPTETNDSKATADAATISDRILNYVAAADAQDKNQTTAINDLVDAISKVQASADTTYKNAVIEKVAEATGLNSGNVTKIIDNAGGISGLVSIFTNLSDEQKESVLNNASAYVDGYSDAQDLANAYAILIDNTKTIAEKNAALDQLETDIKTHYQTSNDTVYKKTYVEATSAATGLSEDIVKQILEADDPRTTAASLLGVTTTTDGGGESAAQGTADAAAAAEVVSSLQGKSLTELISNTDLITQVGTYKTAYENGSDEYKAAFKQGLIDSGISNDVITILSSDGEIDPLALATALGVTL